jgi:predicted amidohydrolase
VLHGGSIPERDGDRLYNTVSVGVCRAGLATCYDLRFPELFRRLVDAGSELVLLVSGWPFPRRQAWKTLGRARAIENQVAYVGLQLHRAPGRPGVRRW